MDAKVIRRQKIRYNIRKTVSGTAQRPRLSVFRSNADIYAQLIDDENGATLAAASTKDKDINAQKTPKVAQLLQKRRLWELPLLYLTGAAIYTMDV
jgi:large subunit ribosomal protein L18